jgi:hypothetical protein
LRVALNPPNMLFLSPSLPPVWPLQILFWWHCCNLLNCLAVVTSSRRLDWLAFVPTIVVQVDERSSRLSICWHLLEAIVRFSCTTRKMLS